MVFSFLLLLIPSLFAISAQIQYLGITPQSIAHESITQIPVDISYIMRPWWTNGTSSECTISDLETEGDGLACQAVVGCQGSGGNYLNEFHRNFAFSSPGEDHLNIWYQTTQLALSNFGIDALIPPTGVVIEGIKLTVVKKSFPKFYEAPTALSTRPVNWDLVRFDGTNKMFDRYIKIRLPSGEVSGNKGYINPGFEGNSSWCLLYPYDKQKCGFGRIQWSDILLPWVYGHETSLWDEPALNGNPSGFPGTYINATSIRDSDFSVLIAAQMDQPANNQACCAELFNRDLFIDYVGLDIYASVTWDVTGISPVNGSSSATDIVVNITVPGIADTNQILVKFQFLTGELVESVPSALDTEFGSLTAPLPTNFGKTGTVDIDVSLNNGMTFSGNPVTFTYLVPCQTDCEYPIGGQCNNVTGLCSCNRGYSGSNCEFNCFETLEDTSSCSQCSAVEASLCSFCLDDMSCAPCPDSFSPGLAINFTTTTCPSIGYVEPATFSDPLLENRTIIIHGSEFISTSDLFCFWTESAASNSWNASTTVTFFNSSFLECPVPVYPNVPENSLVAIQLDVRRNYSGELIKMFYPTLSVTFGQISSGEDGEVKTVSGITGEGAAAIAAGIAAGGLLCCGGFFAYARYKKRLMDDKFRSFLSPPIFTLESAFENYYYVGSSDQKKISTAQEWFYLEEVLLRPDKILLSAVDSVSGSVEKDLIRSILYIHEQAGQTIDLFRHGINHCIEIAETGATLFRGANLASQSWSALVQMQSGLNHLHSTLAMPMYDICSKYASSDKVIELKATDMANTDEITVYKYNLMESCQKMFNAIEESIDTLPPNMKIILNELKSQVGRSKFPDYRLKIVGGFLFLRYFCPAIASPVTYGMLKQEPSDSANRLLILASKTLMNLANGVKFGVKEEYMQVMNDFVTTNIGEVMSIYSTASSFHSEESDSEEDDDQEVDDIVPEYIPELLPEGVLSISRAILLNYILENRADIYKFIHSHADSDNSKQVDSLLTGVLQEIGQPVELDIEVDEVF